MTADGLGHRENNFDGLRLLGAFMVLGSHQFALSGRPEPIPVAPYNLGTLGVLIFFSISGFLVASSWKSDPHLLRFATRRMLRIWPALAVVVLSLSILAAIFNPAARWDALSFLKNLLFMHVDGKFFPANTFAEIDGPIWTIPIEVSCYLAFALLATTFRTWLRLALIATFCLGLSWIASFTDAGMTEAAHRMGHPTYGVWFAAFFLFGAVLCAWPKMRSAVAVWALVGCAAIFYGKAGLGLLLMVPPLAVWVGLCSWPIVRKSGRFGDFSYGLYLLAWPVQQTVLLYLGRAHPPLLLGAISAAITLSLAYVLWHAVERRALALKPRRPLSGQVLADGRTMPIQGL